MSTVIILSGLPGSGKSTYANHIKANSVECSVEIVSSDAIRLEVSGNYTTWRDERKVWSIFWERVYNSKADTVICDATFLTSSKRIEAIHNIKQHLPNAKIDEVQMTTSIETCLQRNADRTRVVPANVIHDMSKRLNTFSATELALADCSYYCESIL